MPKRSQCIRAAMTTPSIKYSIININTINDFASFSIHIKPSEK